MANQKRNQDNRKKPHRAVVTLTGSQSKRYNVNNIISFPNSYLPVNAGKYLPTSAKPVFSDKKYELTTFPFVSDFQKASLGINDLEEIYGFLNEREIEHYLINNRFLITFLKDTKNEIESYFKSNQIFLELVNDPDLSESPNLLVIINTSADVDSVLESQKKFDEHYWLHSPLNITENIIISFEFK